LCNALDSGGGGAYVPIPAQAARVLFFGVCRAILEKVNFVFTFRLTPDSGSASIRLPAAGRLRFLEN
jgi:hypothetical protein